MQEHVMIGVVGLIQNRKLEPGEIERESLFANQLGRFDVVVAVVVDDIRPGELNVGQKSA
jgi:hypothetical protein